MWIAKGRIIEHEYEYDFKEALRVYTLAKKAGKKGATLHCCNAAFPPPEKYLPHTVVKVKKVKKGGKIRKVRVEVEVNPMLQANHKGIWWCPYCIEFRRFIKRTGFRHEGHWIPEPAMRCPMCEISHENWHVRKYNPYASRITFRRTRRSTKSARRRKRG